MNDRQKNRTESRNLQAVLEDTARLEKLRRLRLLDSPADPAFDRLTRLASDMLNMPVSLVSLVDVDRQFFKSQVGLPEPWATTRQTPLSHSFCQHVVATNEPLIIENARQHPLVQDNLAIMELNVIAYAGIPLITSDNIALGSFCAIDNQPHEWTQKEIGILSDLAAAVMAEIELRDQLLKRQEAEKRLKSEQKALSIAHQELEHILQNSLDLIGTANLEGYFTRMNSACETILGYTPEEMLGRPFIEFVHPDDIEATQAEANRLAEGKVTHAFQNRYRTKEGDFRWLTWNATAHPEKGLLYFVARDDTEYKNLQDRLRLAYKETRDILESITDGFVAMNDQWEFTYVNDSAERLLRQTSQNLLGQNIWEIFKDAVGAPFQQAFQRVVAEQKTEAFTEYYAPLETWFDIKANPTSSGMSIYFRDVTAQKQAEKQLQLTLEREMELNELKSRFVSMATHEFKTPLAVIQTSVDLLKLYGDRVSEEKKQGKLETITTQIRRLDDLLNDTLTLTKADMKGLDFNPTFLDLGGFCKAIVEEVQLTCKETQQIVFSHNGDCGPVLIDERLLRHALTNILSNALKYSPDADKVVFDLICEQSEVLFRIKDEGIGIPKADQSLLFEAFQRANNVGNISGTGLGLRIAQQSTEAHGGSITFESEEGAGTTFTITIPRLKYGRQISDQPLIIEVPSDLKENRVGQLILEG